MFKGTLVLGFWLFLVPLLGAQNSITWVTDFETALARSKAENRPILVAMHKLKEIACTRMTKLYQDPAVQQKMAGYIVVPTCLDTHPTLKQKTESGEVETCSAFPGITCVQHVAAERQIHERYFDGPAVKVPQHLVLNAEGKVLVTKVYEMKKTAFLDFLDRGTGFFKGTITDGMDAQTKTLLDLVRSGTQQEREASVKAILDFKSDAKTDLLFDAIAELKEEKDRAVCIRAMGYDQFEHAGLILIRWLEDDSLLLQNSAVVSLEETESPAARPLLDLFAVAKDAELKKDIVRALGPCGEGKDEVKKLLLGLVASSDEKMRAAVYMSLGWFMEDSEVRTTLAARWKKEGKDVTLKTAILFAYRQGGDPELVPEVDKLMQDEKNNALGTLAEAVKLRLKGQEEPGGRQMRQLVKPLYARDKIVRNRVKEWEAYGGGGGRR